MALQSALALAAVLGLFALMVWGMRRFQLKTSLAQHDFKVMRKLYIDNRNSIVEIRHRGRLYLLGVSAAGLTQLRAELSLAEQADSVEVVRQTTPGEL